MELAEKIEASDSTVGLGREPLPCPFCGEAATYQSSNAIAYVVKCTGCGAQGQQFEIPHYTTKTHWFPLLRLDAIAAWNRRSNGRRAAELEAGK